MTSRWPVAPRLTGLENEDRFDLKKHLLEYMSEHDEAIRAGLETGDNAWLSNLCSGVMLQFLARAIVALDIAFTRDDDIMFWHPSYLGKTLRKRHLVSMDQSESPTGDQGS